MALDTSKKRKPGRKAKPPRASVQTPWRFYIGYFVLMLVLLLVWQQLLPLAIRTISYSEFKASMARGVWTDARGGLALRPGFRFFDVSRAMRLVVSDC